MEQKLQNSSSSSSSSSSSFVVCDRLIPLAANYQWLQLDQSEEDDGDRNMNEPLSYHPCRIPALMGRRIRGCFHGWVILSTHPDSLIWSLWNPTTLKTIHLPLMVLKDGDLESIDGDCCLPSPPDDTGSVLLLTRGEQRTFVFCRLDRKRKRLRRTEMTYAKQLKTITGQNGFLKSLTCCNGKVYALNSGLLYDGLIQVDIVVKDEQVVITLLPFVDIPYGTPCNNYFSLRRILKGCAEKLFFVVVGVRSEAMRTLTAAHLLELDMTSMIWEKPKDLDNTMFFMDLSHPSWLFYKPTVTSESGGGYIHIFGNVDRVISSYSLKDNTVSLSSTTRLAPPTHVPFWECRANEEDMEDEVVARDDELVYIDSPLFNISFDVLKMIMHLCVGVEYLNFRATCKQCRLAAPVIRWRNETSVRRLHTYSLPSPWLMVFDTERGVIIFIDPMFGDKYFMKAPQELFGDVRISCSGYGWLLVYNLVHTDLSVMLFNPFTNDIRKLTYMGYMINMCFSAPPTCSDCMVVGFVPKRTCGVFVHFVNWSPEWGRMVVDFGESVPRSVSFPTLYGRDVYALEAGGRLDVYRLMEDHQEGRFWEVVAEAPRGCPSTAQCFLVKCDLHRLLLVRVEEYGESVEVFKLNQTAQEWEKLDCLGRRMVYICDAACLCMEAKTPEMENKIYFPRLHSESGKIVFYSLETCRYHTFDGRKLDEESFADFLGTKYILSPHAWIEPSWC